MSATEDFTVPNLPPLVPLRELKAVEPAPARRAGVVAVVSLLALMVALAGVGWGFTQWSSARSWKHRSQTMEAQFNTLQTRASTAEAARGVAERAAAQNRASLVATQNRLAQVANEQAFTRDLRQELCTATSDFLTPDERARICS